MVFLGIPFFFSFPAKTKEKRASLVFSPSRFSLFFVLDEKHKTKSTLKDTRRERKKKKEKKKKTTASSCLLEREQRERRKDEWGREICGVWS